MSASTAPEGRRTAPSPGVLVISLSVGHVIGEKVQGSQKLYPVPCRGVRWGDRADDLQSEPEPNRLDGSEKSSGMRPCGDTTQIAELPV